MKNTYLPLAGLLIIGILGASGSNNTAAIDNSISSADIAKIARIAENNDIEINSIDRIGDQNAINGAIWANAIKGIRIERSEISDISLIAIGNIIDTGIQASQIDAGIIDIAA